MIQAEIYDMVTHHYSGHQALLKNIGTNSITSSIARSMSHMSIRYRTEHVISLYFKQTMKIIFGCQSHNTSHTFLTMIYSKKKVFIKTSFSFFVIGTIYILTRDRLRFIEIKRKKNSQILYHCHDTRTTSILIVMLVVMIFLSKRQFSRAQFAGILSRQ